MSWNSALTPRANGGGSWDGGAVREGWFRGIRGGRRG